MANIVGNQFERKIRIESPPHIDFIERGEHRVRVLGVFETLRDALTHAVHLDSDLKNLKIFKSQKIAEIFKTLERLLFGWWILFIQ